MNQPSLKKRLGQHHLRHAELCRPVVEFLAPRGRRVVEVGAGGGLLTAELLQAGARVLAVEVDLEWTFLVRRTLGESPRLALVAADALELNWAGLPAGTLVTGNLPFGIATPLIERLLQGCVTLPKAAFLLQQEVARRLLARPGEAAYGSFTVLVQAYAETRLLARVKRGSFTPPPRVEGAFVGLTSRPSLLPRSAMAGFATTVRLAFRKRRKTLFNSLASGWGRQEASRVLGLLGLDSKCRAETLTLHQFRDLHCAHAGIAP